MNPINVSIVDAAKILGIGRTTVFRLISRGDIRTIRIMGRTLIPADQLSSIGVQGDV